MENGAPLYGFETTLTNEILDETKKTNNVLHGLSTLSCHLTTLATLSTSCNKFCKLLNYSLNFVEICISKHINTIETLCNIKLWS